MACVGAPNFAPNFAPTKAIPALNSLNRWSGNVQRKKKLAFSPTMNMQQQKDQMIEQSKASSQWDNKGLLQNQELYNYVVETSVYPREPEFLKEIRTITANHAEFYMGATPDSCQLIAMFLNLINAKKTIEIGVFTGYSLLLTALTIPDDGKILAIDPDRHSYEMGLPVIKKAGVEHKIDFRESTALPVLDKLLEDDENKDSFDFAFVDADKTNYANYLERLMQLVKVGGLIVYDNTLWYGTLVMPEESVSELMRPERNHLLVFNRSLAADNRIQISQVSVGDGMTICRRLF